MRCPEPVGRTSSPLENPLVRYGMGLSSAAILVFVAVAHLDGTVRLVVLGIAALEVVVTPQILKHAAEAEAASQ